MKNTINSLLYMQKNQTTKSNEENENSFYFTTIYLGNPSLKFQKTCKNRFFKSTKVEIKPTYTSRKISNYFNNKNKCLEAINVIVIYKHTCSEDHNIFYVGETSRQPLWLI